MSAFIVIAAAMAAVAIGCIAWPLYRSRASEGRALPATLASVAVLVPLAAFLMYQHWSTWSWDPQAVAAAGQPHSMDEAIAKLEAHLVQAPDDVEGWRMLGRSRMAMNQVPAALAAYEKAYALTGGKDADVLLGYGEALVMTDQNAISGKAGPMFEQALALEPANPKALWYAGLNALRSGNVAQARDRWAALSAQSPAWRSSCAASASRCPTVAVTAATRPAAATTNCSSAASARASCSAPTASS